jgi:2-dehydro-3-deoxyphosphogluconate aldolase/(4S)-4-hydroxy-2-oxoglutarate aldolase
VQIKDILNAGPVIPVISLHELSHAVPLAQAMTAGGARVIEINVQTPIAIEAVASIRQSVPQAIVGVGTVTSAKEIQAAMDAGAQFASSPASSMWLLDAVKEYGFPFLPGVMTPSEVLAARDAGFHELKLYPAQEAGGAALLRAFGAVFADVRFCPIGGITPSNAREYLSLSNVSCIGGSWMAPKVLIEAGDWNAIEQLARDAQTLRAGLDMSATQRISAAALY